MARGLFTPDHYTHMWALLTLPATKLEAHKCIGNNNTAGQHITILFLLNN